MERIQQDMSGYRMPVYVEEILTENYCKNFISMSIKRESGSYSFSYKPGCFTRLDTKSLGTYDKLVLLRNLISMSESTSDHLIDPENYLLEPELIYAKDRRVDLNSLRLMFYPDIRKLDFRYKIVIFAGRLFDETIREERELADKLRSAAEPGDINRIKLFLDKNILRMENRMTESRTQKTLRA